MMDYHIQLHSGSSKLTLMYHWFQLDGGRFNEMRQIVAEVGVVSKADGFVFSSAVYEMGNTKVIAVVYGPREIQNKSLQKKNDHAFVCICFPELPEFLQEVFSM
ncbi:PREDICTED: exosome complex component RRP41 homolog [Camelina sativa]|uniref:Exosome complex component RRP41 homolog n=1 Tax=Camelina sativa TaxID=90675 RepID=A0ABM1QM58_CAMSA|nr:PREDICTED: exosome complex component RRP41 homolog [Camelina sativa]